MFSFLMKTMPKEKQHLQKCIACTGACWWSKQEDLEPDFSNSYSQYLQVLLQIVQPNPSELKKEWKRLRDGYRQALITRQASKNPFKRRLPLRPWKYEEKMSFLKPYMTPRSRLLANPPDSENDEYEYHPLAAGEEKEEILHNIITNMKREVLSDEERLPQSSACASPETSCKHQHLVSLRESSESEHIEKEKKELDKVAGSAVKRLKRKIMVNNNDSSSKQPCVNIIVPDKEGNLTISLANEKSKPKRLRYVTFASNLQNCAGPSSTILNNPSISLNNSQSTNPNNTTPVIIMNEKSIEKIISNFENSNNNNIAISSVIGNCSRTSNGNFANNTATSSGTCNNNSAITSSGDKPSTSLETSNAEESVNNAVQTNLSSFFRNVAIQCEIPKANKDGELIKKQSSINDLKNGAVAVFIHPKPNLPRSDDESDEDGLVSRRIRVRKYRIPEFRCDPKFANTHCFGHREQVYRAVRPSTSSNGNHGTRSIELFIASIYQTIKELPWQGQNVIKTRSLEFLKVAEEEFEQVKVQWNKNEKKDSSKPQAELLDLDLTSLYPTNNQDASNKNNQDASNKDNQDASNKNNQDASGRDNQDSCNKVNQGTSNQLNQGTYNQLNQGAIYTSGQSYNPISSLQSTMSIFGDNDGRHIALQLFLASVYESMKNMPSYLLSYLKTNLMQLVVHVEEVYNNPDDVRNNSVNNKNSE